MTGGLTGGETFERGANFRELDQIAVGRFAHTGAPQRLADDEPEQFEIAERLTNRPLTDADLLSDPGFDDPVTRLQIALEDRVEEIFLDILTEDPPAGA